MKVFSFSGRFNVIVVMPSPSVISMCSYILFGALFFVLCSLYFVLCACSLWRAHKYQERRTKNKDLFPLKLRLAFVSVGVETFLRVFRLKELLLQLAFERERGFK